MILQGVPAETTERVRLSVAEARALSERAMRGIGYEAEEARILADHVIDAALCGYEYSGLPKLLNVADDPRHAAGRRPMRVVKGTSVSVLFDGGNQSGMLGMYHATRAAIERASTHGFALVGVNDIWMSGRSAYYVEMAARAGLIAIHTVAVRRAQGLCAGARDPRTRRQRAISLHRVQARPVRSPGRVPARTGCGDRRHQGDAAAGRRRGDPDSRRARVSRACTARARGHRDRSAHPRPADPARRRQALISRIGSLALVMLLLVGCLPGLRGDAISSGEWPNYGNDAGGSRYSPLTQIDRGNVARLRVAWTYRTGETVGVPGPWGHYAFEATPVMADGTVVFSTPYNRVIALDAETGNERWTWDAKVDRTRRVALATSRGVSTWLDVEARADRTCRRRIFVGTVDARLVALDAATGTPCAGFGRSGQVDLTEGIAVIDRCCYQVTSPPAGVNGLVVVGSAIGDNRGANLERGVVRAYDARTGALRWSWDPIPTRESDPARATWAGDSWRRTGAANVWSVMSVDVERGLGVLPTSSPSPDFYGGERLGANVYANSVVALRAATADVVWHFQAVHHDLWDYDVPAQPVLLNVSREGKPVPAVVVATKMGHVFVLHRDTGAPLFPIEERAVP